MEIKSAISDLTECTICDLDEKYIGNLRIKKSLPGKKIKSVEILVKIANSH